HSGVSPRCFGVDFPGSHNFKPPTCCEARLDRKNPRSLKRPLKRLCSTLWRRWTTDAGAPSGAHRPSFDADEWTLRAQVSDRKSNMAEVFTYKACPTRFHCGSENSHVQLVNLWGPNNSRLTAYSCSMNVDVDGEPQAYGPPDIHPVPRDSLQDAGWLSPGKNAEKRAAYDQKFPAAMQRLNDLTDRLHAKNPPLDHATKVAIEKDIGEVRKELHKLNPYYADKPMPVNNGKVFWHWYGVSAMTEEQGRREIYDAKMPGIPPRHPELHVKPELVDVHGKYPVVQSKYEPGPGYYVSPISAGFGAGSNQKFRPWDQRYYLPADVVSSNDPVQAPYGALSSGLTRIAGVHLHDQVFAINRATGATLTFPFMDGPTATKLQNALFLRFSSSAEKRCFSSTAENRLRKKIDAIGTIESLSSCTLRSRVPNRLGKPSRISPAPPTPTSSPSSWRFWPAPGALRTPCRNSRG